MLRGWQIHSKTSEVLNKITSAKKEWCHGSTVHDCEMNPANVSGFFQMLIACHTFDNFENLLGYFPPI